MKIAIVDFTKPFTNVEEKQLHETAANKLMTMGHYVTIFTIPLASEKEYEARMILSQLRFDDFDRVISMNPRVVGITHAHVKVIPEFDAGEIMEETARVWLA